MESFGLKVFTDAHDTVTVEEGDRYPLRPPILCQSSLTRLLRHQPVRKYHVWYNREALTDVPHILGC